MSKKKIVIVDDDPRNIFALSANLKAKGFECKSFTGAREVLKMLNGTEVADVVLMDMMMPDMDGYEAITEIRKIENRSRLPVIAVTAQAMHGDKEKCLQAGADAYISKPVDFDKLLELLAGFNIK